MRHLYRNEIARRVATVLLSFFVFASFVPDFALQNAFALDEAAEDEAAVVQEDSTEAVDAEEAQEDAVQEEETEAAPVLKAPSNAPTANGNQITGHVTVDASTITAGISDKFQATCTADFDVTGHISVELYRKHRITKSWIWDEKAGSNTDYNAGETITITKLLTSTDDYGNAIETPSVRKYRFVIEQDGNKYVSNEFTITWAYPIVKAKVTGLGYPVANQTVAPNAGTRVTYLDGKGKEQTTTEGATVTKYQWYEHDGSGKTTFNGKFNLDNTYSATATMKANEGYFFPEGGESSKLGYNNYEKNGTACKGEIHMLETQFAGVSNSDNTKLYIESKETTPLEGKYVYRIAGDTRYDTALKIADEQKSASGKFENVVLAYGENYPDALAGSFLAIDKKAPILLIEGADRVKNKVLNYIYDNVDTNGNVYILGGTSAIPDSIKNALEEKGYTVTRLGGASRYETNMKILEAAPMEGKPVIISSGTGYADSLSASSTGYPIMIVDPAKGLSNEQISFLKSKGSNNFYIIGGEAALPKSIEDKLSSLGTVKRLAGATRYQTSQLVAEEFSPDTRLDNVVIAYGENFPDGLCAGPLASTKGASLILSENGAVATAKAYVDNHAIMYGYVTGGTKLISNASAMKIMSADTVVNK